MNQHYNVKYHLLVVFNCFQHEVDGENDKQVERSELLSALRAARWRVGGRRAQAGAGGRAAGQGGGQQGEAGGHAGTESYAGRGEQADVQTRVNHSRYLIILTYIFLAKHRNP